MKARISDHRKAFNIMDKDMHHSEGSMGVNRISNNRDKGCNVDLIP